MTPVAPEPRETFRSVIFAKDQPEYISLPANTNGSEVETKWRLSWKERVKLLFTGSIYLTLLTFGNPLQPIKLTIDRN